LKTNKSDFQQDEANLIKGPLKRAVLEGSALI